MSPTMQSRTGTSSAPTSRTVDIVNRRPTCRPMPANAASRSTGGTDEAVGQQEADDAREEHRAQQRPGGQPGQPRDEDARRGEDRRQDPALDVAERADAVVRRPGVVPREHDRHEHRRRHDDDEHPQVLHERDEPVVRLQLARHADDARRPAGDHAERRGRAVEARPPREHDAAEEAEPERREAHERHGDPRVGRGLERVGLQVGAERDARERLRRAEADRRDLEPRPGATARRRARPAARRTGTTTGPRRRRTAGRRRTSRGTRRPTARRGAALTIRGGGAPRRPCRA